MTLISYMTIAYLLSCLLNLNPVLTVIGSIFPDLIEIPFSLKHRKETHKISFTSYFFISKDILKFFTPKLSKSFYLGLLFPYIFRCFNSKWSIFFPLKKRICLAPFLKIKTASFSEFIFVVLSFIILGILILVKPILVHYLNYSFLYEKAL